MQNKKIRHDFSSLGKNETIVNNKILAYGLWVQTCITIWNEKTGNINTMSWKVWIAFRTLFQGNTHIHTHRDAYQHWVGK